MNVRPLDTLLAIKAIGLEEGLKPSDRRVGVLLLEHYNRRTGRCDPSMQRMGSLLGLSVRTIIRSTQRLEKAGLFRKTRHGGNFNNNFYEPMWARFADLHAAWQSQELVSTYQPGRSDVC
jgi:hypothetical protein